MNIGIFGSCVSRDTCEFMPDSTVLTYVARQSVVSLERPHGDGRMDLSGLASAFQHRMVVGDLRGNGLEQIVNRADELDVVLIDLVDERRGYWNFADGTIMTNSLEVESCGAAREARRFGARLVSFGTDEHFTSWKSGFQKLVNGLNEAQLLSRAVFLDIEWAAAVDGAQHPQNDRLSLLGRRARRVHRGAREARRSLSRGQGLSDVLTNLWNVRPTEAEEFADRAVTANAEYTRYRALARALISSTVTRTSAQLRIGRDHKWGAQPFHYRDQDYRSIVESLIDQVESFGPE